MEIENDKLDVLRTGVSNLLDIVMETYLSDDPDNVDPALIKAGVMRFVEQLDVLGEHAGESGLVGLQNVDLLFREALAQSVASAAGPDDAVREQMEAWPMLVLDYLESPTEQQAISALVEHLKACNWNESLSEDEVKLLYDLFADAPAQEDSNIPSVESSVGHDDDNLQLAAQPEDKSSAAPIESEDVHGADAISPEEDEGGQEYIDILCVELADMSDSQEHLLALLADPEVDTQQVSEAMEGQLDNVERIGSAAEAIGLAGLQEVCIHLGVNIAGIGSASEVPHGVGDLVGAWPVQLLSYLQAHHDRTVCADLTAYLQDSGWPQPLDEDGASLLVDSLATERVEVEADAEVHERQRHAQLDDISLDLPQDVNPELLDSLLQELPLQTAEFSEIIQKFSSGVGTPEDIHVAQRIAHTLKGAANTVGVRGIAHLTHCLEDILVAFDKQKALPNDALNHSLMNAADCLEGMSEAVMGLGDPPSEEERLRVLQEVLDWANLIDIQGVPAGDHGPKERKSLPGLNKGAASSIDAAQTDTFATAGQASASHESSSASPTARLSTGLIDEILRLAGETMILNGQIQDRLQRTILAVHSAREQDRILLQLASDLEQLIDIRGLSSGIQLITSQGKFDSLEMDQYNELHTLSRRLIEAAADNRELDERVEMHLADLNDLLILQSRLHRENEETVMRTRMVPVQTIVPRLQRSVRQTCRLTDKLVNLNVAGGNTLIDSNVLNDLVDPLMHVVRNAIDHGIEAPEAREATGKEGYGKIDLSIFRDGGNVVVRCQDDGAGLDFETIRHKAEQRGLIQSNDNLSKDELSRLILNPGFTTRDAVTQVSGRGIGMDAVYSQVLKLKGALQIHSEDGAGCVVELRIPVTLMSVRGLLITAGNQTFTVAERGVQQILFSTGDEYTTVGRNQVYKVGDEVYEAVAMESLLRLPMEPDTDLSTRPALIVQDETGIRLHAVLVKEVKASRDFVVKSLGRYLPPLAGVMGATILGDGSVSTVLDMPDLLRIASSEPVARATTQAQGTTQAASAPCAMVVDDSLSARRSLSQFMEDLGYEVLVARDGVEATTVLEEKIPDIVFVDLEMPRMNGLELTAYIRNRTATRNLPVVMITSRSTEKHRQEAQSVGVDRYLTKPFAEDELASLVHELLSVRGAA